MDYVFQGSQVCLQSIVTHRPMDVTAFSTRVLTLVVNFKFPHTCSGNNLEFKAMTKVENLFAKYNVD